MGRRVLAAALVVVGLILLVSSLVVPRYACRTGYSLVRDEGPGASPNGWACRRSDVGSVPDSRLPEKIGLAIIGFVLVSGGGVIILMGSRLAHNSTAPI
jgi:hypothetical protein